MIGQGEADTNLLMQTDRRELHCRSMAQGPQLRNRLPTKTGPSFEDATAVHSQAVMIHSHDTAPARAAVMRLGRLVVAAGCAVSTPFQPMPLHVPAAVEGGLLQVVLHGAWVPRDTSRIVAAQGGDGMAGEAAHAQTARARNVTTWHDRQAGTAGPGAGDEQTRLEEPSEQAEQQHSTHRSSHSQQDVDDKQCSYW